MSIPDDLETTLETPNPHDAPEPKVAKTGAASLSVVEPGHYEITKEIGQGGMGRVILAKDQRLSREVAIKELLPVGREAIPRFIREAQVTAKLQHPSILPIYELGRWPNGKPFYAMKLIQGKSLGDTLEKYQTLEQRLTLLPRLIAACDAIAYAHQEGVIHRDLKPDNIMLGPFGETIVIDWGLAKELKAGSVENEPEIARRFSSGSSGNEERPAKLTVDGNIIGTPAYMPLEQAHGQPLDARADVYSLGAILYETLSGSAPYGGKTTEEVLLSLHQRAPSPLRSLVPRAPHELLAIVEKAMSRDKSARYPSAKELSLDLRRFQEGQLVAAYEYTKAERIGRWVKQHKASLSLAFASVLALLALGIVSYVKVKRERDLAVSAQQRELEAKQREAARADELVLLQAQRALELDPASALRWLSQLSKGSPRWGDAGLIAADANERGTSSTLISSEGAANDLALSSTQDLLAAAFDRGLWLQDLSTHKQIELTGHTAEVSLVEFSPDGRSLASGDRSGLVLLWDVSCVLTKNDASCHSLVARHGAEVTALTFSPDGKTVASASADGLILLGGSGRCTGHTARVQRLRFSSDGAWLASSSFDDTIRLWAPSRCSSQAIKSSKISIIPSDKAEGLPTNHSAPSSPELASAVLSHDGEVIDFVISPNNQTIYSVSQDQRLRAWGVSDQRERLLFQYQRALTTLALSPDGRSLAFGAEDGALFLLDTKADKEVVAPKKVAVKVSCPRDAKPTPAGGCECVSGFASDGTSCSPRPRPTATGENKLPSELFSLKKPKPEVTVPVAVRPLSVGRPGLSGESASGGARELPGHSEAVLVLRFSDDGAQLASAGRDKQVKVISVSSGQVQTFVGHQDRVSSLLYLKERGSLLSASWDGTVRAWSLDKNEQKPLPEGASPLVTWLQGKSSLLRVGVGGSRLYLWEPGEAAKMIENNAKISAIAASPDKKLLAVGAVDGSVRLYQGDTLSAKVLPETKSRLASISSMVFSQGGALVVSAEKTVWLWDGLSGSALFDAELPISSIAVSSDASWVAAADGEGTVYLWSVQTKAKQKIAAHTNYVHAVTFSPDAKLLASASEDGGICLFRVGGGAACERLSGHSLGVRALAFSPDASRLLSGGYDRSVRLWDVAAKTSVSWQGHRGSIFALSFLQDGKTALSVADDNAAYLWDVSSGAKRALRTSAQQLAVDLSPDDRSILILSSDGQLKSFQNDTPQEEAALRAWINEKLSD